MKVFVFCVALLLATAVKASPINVDDAESSNEINVENTDEIKDEVQVDPLPEADVDPVPESFAVDEEEEEDESPAEENEVENENSEINEDSEPEAVPYEDEEAKALQIEEEPELTEEEKERHYGIAIDLCNMYTSPRNPLHLSHLTDCGKFYKCYNGRGYLMDCPAGEHWAVNLDRCDYPGIAKCKINGTYRYKVRKTQPMQASEQVEEEDEKPETGDFEIDPRCEGSDPFKPMHYKHVNDCTKFYKCYMGKAYVIKCPRGQHWAQQMNRCEHPVIAKCTIKPTAVKPPVPVAPVRPAPGIKPAQAEESGSSESEEYEYDYYDNGPNIADDPDFMIKDSRCAPDDTDRFHPTQFAHPTDCTMFYKCFDHVAYKIQCPGGLHYDEENEQCDYPEVAECKVGIAQAQAQESYSPSVPNCPKDKDVKLPVDGSFNQYFSCMGGLAYLMECEEHEIFNPMTKTCQESPMQIQPYPNFPNSPDVMNQIPGSMIPQFPGGMPQMPGMMPGMPQMPGMMPGMPQMPGMMPGMPGMMPSMMPGMPGMMPGMPGMIPGMPNSPESMQQMSEWMNQFFGMMQQHPEMMNQFPGMMPQMPMPQMPIPNKPQPEVKPVEKPQAPPKQEQKPELPEFPSWMPIPNPNVQLPQLPSLEKPSHEKPTNKNEFNYSNGKVNSRCPSSDDPTKPQHLAHETECGKFYKCFNGRAFLMDCPVAQEWSEELQRCDYHQFANCDPTELIKKKMQL